MFYDYCFGVLCGILFIQIAAMLYFHNIILVRVDDAIKECTEARKFAEKNMKNFFAFKL